MLVQVEVFVGIAPELSWGRSPENTALSFPLFFSVEEEVISVNHVFKSNVSNILAIRLNISIRDIEHPYPYPQNIQPSLVALYQAWLHCIHTLHYNHWKMSNDTWVPWIGFPTEKKMLRKPNRSILVWTLNLKIVFWFVINLFLSSGFLNWFVLISLR